MIDARTLRTDFPILQRRINNKPLLYLDSAATSQRPRPVLQTIQVMNTRYNANIHRAGHSLGLEATELYEQAHENVARFINADSMEEIIFVRNTTEAINLVAYSLALGGAESPQIGAGDEIVLTVMEHHSNLVPWQMVRDQTGAVLRFVGIHADGTLNMDEYRAALTPRTRLVACTHMSNVLGTITPVQEICSLAHQVGALVLIDGAQSAPHLPVDVQALGCDFYAFSGHKMLAPMGVGVLYGRRELLETMRPFLYGGDMIRHVTLDTADWNRLPWKFEAGTANVADGVALGGAVDLRSGQELVGAVGYLHRLGMEQVREHEVQLTTATLAALEAIPRVQVYGPRDPELRGAVISFNVEGLDGHLVARLLDDEGIAVRSGGHCAYPLMEALGVESTVRASLYIYNTLDEIDRFAEVLASIAKQE